MANYMKLKVAQAIGWVSSVETKPDVYKDYYLTSAEIANPRNIDAAQVGLLKGDPRFKDQQVYLVTGVQEQESGDLKQRRFLLTANDARKLGIPELKEGQKLGGQNKVILDKKFTFSTLGQYLEEMDLGIGKVHIANIYPRVQEAKAEAVRPADTAKVNDALAKNKTSTTFDWHFQSPRPKTGFPKLGL